MTAGKKEKKKTIVEALTEIKEVLQRIETELEGVNKQIGFKNNYDR